MTLLILAAGMGSRYGGLKQMDPMGPSGETVLDYSVYDALRSGFNKIVFVIRRDFEEAFRREIGARFEAAATVSYAFQSLERIPRPFTVPPGRSKPWGTGHALLCARDLVDQPFCVINADDFYGLSAYQLMHGFLTDTPDHDFEGRGLYAMAGYRLDQTLSDYGAVARGLCEVDDQHELVSVTEITDIRHDAQGPCCTDTDGSRRALTGQEIVSLNFWALRPGVFPLLDKLFRKFLERSAAELRSEFYIPTALDALVQQGLVRVRVAPADSTWFGVTYQEDRPWVRVQLRRLVDSGVYPEDLWSNTSAASARP